ncbi:unnamed protein product [Calicophoron daubneyi]|uniref:CRAL-TRIO domain-containing protein n=1 Tax=Calicophoron daubneyi TaxID=300641 RepID=A0AAV2TQ84_CALDB
MNGFSVYEDESNVLDQFSEEQKNIIEEFMQKVSDIKRTECSSRIYLSRWLRARDWNIQDAEKMLRDHINWRNEYKVDSILSWHKKNPIIEKYLPFGFFGEDKEGNPIYWGLVGRMDPKTFWKAVNRSDFMQHGVYHLEYAIKVLFPEISRRTGRRIDHICLLLDMTGMGLKHMSSISLSVASEYLQMLEGNYPEFLASCFVINVPRVFNAMYTFLKPLLGPSTQAKVHVCTSNYSEVFEEFLNMDSLPAFYGGKQYDPNGDPQCPSRLCWGGPVPNEYFLKGDRATANVSDGVVIIPSNVSEVLPVGQDKMILVRIPRSSLCEIPLGLLPPGTRIDLSLLCANRDIKVSIDGDPAPECANSVRNEGEVKNPSSTVSSISSSFSDNAKDSFDQANVSGVLSSSSDEQKDQCQTIEVLPARRTANRSIPFRFHCEIQIPGFYRLRFDNTYSWITPKRVYYLAQIRYPSNSSTIQIATKQQKIDDVNSLLNGDASDCQPKESNSTILRKYLGDCKEDSGSKIPIKEDEDVETNGCGEKDSGIEVHTKENVSEPSNLEPKCSSRARENSSYRSNSGGCMDVDVNLLNRLFVQLFLLPQLIEQEPR